MPSPFGGNFHFLMNGFLWRSGEDRGNFFRRFGRCCGRWHASTWYAGHPRWGALENRFQHSAFQRLARQRTMMDSRRQAVKARPLHHSFSANQKTWKLFPALSLVQGIDRSCIFYNVQVVAFYWGLDWQWPHWILTSTNRHHGLRSNDE